MRNLTIKKTVRCLFAAEGYLELQLPERAIQELNRIEDAGELSPYASYLRGQALRSLNRYGEAIDALQEAAQTIPAPFNRWVWGDLSDCFRQEGLSELADVADLFAEDPLGGADRDLPEASWDPFLSEFGDELSMEEWSELGDRFAHWPFDDFEDFRFEADGFENEADASDASNSSSRHLPPK